MSFSWECCKEKSSFEAQIPCAVVCVVWCCSGTQDPVPEGDVCLHPEDGAHVALCPKVPTQVSAWPLCFLLCFDGKHGSSQLKGEQALFP